jgi:hypothetical protein
MPATVLLLMAYHPASMRTLLPPALGVTVTEVMVVGDAVALLVTLAEV